MPGKLYGLGVGPGDSELLTLKAKRILEEVDIICTPQSKPEKDSIALKIVKEVIDCEERVKRLLFPMTHHQKELKKYWRQATAEVVDLLQQGKDVAFITIGDPLLYSTYIYILKRIKKDYQELNVETVPGITSINACSAQMNLPLAEGNEKVAIVPAVYDYDQLEDTLVNNDNVILMKVARKYDQIVDLLDKLNLKESSTFISRCGQQEEFITTDLDSLVGKKLDYLSMIIVKSN